MEDDPIDPVTVYGKTMAEGEQLLPEADPAACILRISLPMGVSFNGHAGAIDWITSRFKKSRPATLYFDEIRTPTYTDCMNPLYEVMLANDLSGVFHAGGPRRLSLYQIAQIINRVGGYDPELLHGIPRREAGPIPPRAGNVCMDTGKLIAALGYNPFDPWPLDDALGADGPPLALLAAADERGSPERLYRPFASIRRRRNGQPVAPPSGSGTGLGRRVDGGLRNRSGGPCPWKLYAFFQSRRFPRRECSAARPPRRGRGELFLVPSPQSPFPASSPVRRILPP